MKDYINDIKNVLDCEINALEAVRKSIDSNLCNIIEAINNCKGRIIVTGMGKSGHIGKKIAATMASVGIQSFFMHPSEGLHGDLGIVNKDDLVLALSFSGETDEVLNIIPTLKIIGSKIVSIVGKQNSTLEKHSIITYVMPKMKEAFLDNMVPTSSTTATLAIGDAIAITVSKLRHFTKKEFAIFHPLGTLGKKLTLMVSSLLKTGKENAVVKNTASLQDAVLEMCKKGLGCVNIIDKDNNYLGIFTDGDLRRLVSKSCEINLTTTPITKVMTSKTTYLEKDILVSDAVKIMYKTTKPISALPMLKKGKLIGTLVLTDIVKIGLV